MPQSTVSTASAIGPSAVWRHQVPKPRDVEGQQHADESEGQHEAERGQWRKMKRM